ncbi:MAG: sel1 repeat family protein [Lachnospiraceae bacterium]|nr:sel1 repeat family protein [Lachnospiraceae bacterium]
MTFHIAYRKMTTEKEEGIHIVNESIQEYRILLSDNPAKAEKQLYKLAKKGDLQALEALNTYYEKCVTEAKTPKEASKIRQKALKAALLGARHNSPYWLIWVGEMYRYGVGTDRNERKAFSYYEKAAALGDTDGIVKVGRAYLNGIGVPVDYQKSMHFFESAASQNNPEAMVLIAYQYENGKGVAIDYEKPLEWLARAEQSCRLWLKQELSEADRNYYESLLQDVDDKRKHCESVSCVELIGNESCPMEERKRALLQLTELAHNGNNSRAQVSMGILYEEGKLVEQNDKKALDYYFMAAENGSTGAMNNIGNFYLHGKGTGKDYDKAFAWYKKAADLSGNAAAECSLGMCYQYGYGTAVDYEKARYFYELSVKQGLGLAFYRLGLLYEQGLGVAQDIRMAKQYFGEALDRGYREAAFKL